ncbi:hypothetical protein AMTR_s00031p00193190 [Amborella trichopoda]|uniref:Uncharacterized protein n=1 Tax=Amborella trichopoda TaxID=13333 RepID=U5D885_AMBTC|nr:hypothetical protein AMTR_s00031p00193190 [Amborella trichopoda]
MSFYPRPALPRAVCFSVRHPSNAPPPLPTLYHNYSHLIQNGAPLVCAQPNLPFPHPPPYPAANPPSSFPAPNPAPNTPLPSLSASSCSRLVVPLVVPLVAPFAIPVGGPHSTHIVKALRSSLVGRFTPPKE